MTEFVKDNYAKDFDFFFYTRTNEKEVVSKIIIDDVLQKKKGGAFLDVGCGPGLLSKELVKYFDDITLVEPTSDYHKQLINDFPSASLIKIPLQQLELTKKYDFILASQVLYYVNSLEWKNVCQKLFNSLNPAGLLVVILNDHSKADLRILFEIFQDLSEYFNFHYQALSDFKKNLQLFSTVHSFPFNYEVNFDNLKAMACCIGQVALNIQNSNVLTENQMNFENIAKKINTNNSSLKIKVDAEILLIKH